MIKNESIGTTQKNTITLPTREWRRELIAYIDDSDRVHTVSRSKEGKWEIRIYNSNHVNNFAEMKARYMEEFG